MRQQRNIPVTVPIEVQTDINLIHQPITFALDQYEGLALTSPEIQGLVAAHTDSQLLNFFKEEAGFFRGIGRTQNLTEEDLRKRLQWIETQIQGLQKKNITINGKNYYNTLSDLQGQLDKQIIINNNYEPKLREANRRIAELQQEVASLTRARIHEENIKIQNQTLKDAFRNISEIVRNPQRMREIERTVNDTLIPLLDEYDLKFDAMQKSIANIGRATTDVKSKLRAHLGSFLKNIERITKNTEEITLNGLESYVRTFLKDLEVSQTYDQYQKGKLYKHQLEDLQTKFDSSTHVIKDYFQKQIVRNPSLRSLIDFSIFETLSRESVEVHNYNGVITLEGVSWGGRLKYYQVQQQRSKRMLGLLLGQLKTLLKRFPHLRESLRQEVVDIINIEVFDDAISIDEIERILEVIKYKTEIVKVDNVYTYNNEIHLRTIFHLKVMVKALLEELGRLKDRTGAVLEIDEGLLGMIRSQILDFVNPDDVLRVFRSAPKIVEVETIVQRNLSRYQGILTQSKPVYAQHAIFADRVIQRPVTLRQEVGIVIQKPIPIPVIHERPVAVEQQVPVEVPVIREVLVDRIVSQERAIEVPVTVEVPLKQTEFVNVDKIIVQNVQTEIPIEVLQQVPVVTTKTEKEIQVVERFEQRLVEVLREVTNVKEVKVVEQVPIDQIRYIEVQRIVNNFINVPQIVQIKQQVPITITNTVDKPVDVIHTIEKIVQVVNTEEKIVEVQVQRPVPLVQEVPKPYKEQVTILVKGDTEQVIREVQRIVEKPIIREVLQVKQVQVQKAVPVWLREQKPVIVQIKTPFIQNQIQIVTFQKQRIVPYKQEVQLEVIRQIPVPIVCNKQIIRPIRVIVEKIVEKMVEVPRVVEVEKIVEKIVVVPRVIQNIVHVPQIVEKIVEREVQILKIVELQIQRPIYLEKQIQQIVPEVQQKPVERVSIQTVDVQKIVYLTNQTEVIKEVTVQRQVPVQVIVEKEVHVIEEKIVDRLLTVRQVEVQERQVVIPFRQQVPIQVIRDKVVEIKKIIQNIVQVPQIIERDRVLYEVRTQLQIQQVVVERPVEVIKEAVYTDVKNHIEYQPQIVNLTQEVLAVQTQKIDVIKPEPYIVEKIVYLNETHQEAVPVYLEKAVPCRAEIPVQIQIPVAIPAIREVPRDIVREKVVQVRALIDNNKQIPVQVQKVIQVQTMRQEVVQMTEQILKVVVEHQPQQILQQIAIVEEKVSVVPVPSMPIITQEIRQIYREVNEPVILEKVVERVTLLPQIVEVIKHIHEITDTNISSIGLGIADIGVDVQVHTADYIALCTDLRTRLQAAIASIRDSRLPEANKTTESITKLIQLLNSLIRFPNIVQIPRNVQRIVEKQKVVVVPSKDTETLNREIAATALIEKLVEELKRVQRTGVSIQLDDEVRNIFFLQLKNIERMDDKLRQFSNVVLNRFRSLGSWTEQHSQMLNNFLQERFLMAGIVKESNDTISLLKKELEISESKGVKLNDALTRLSIINVGLKNSLDDLIQSLQSSIRGNRGTQPELQSLLARANATLHQLQTNELQESRFRYAAQDAQKLSKQLRRVESELESYRGGDTQRNVFLNNQVNNLRREVEGLNVENQKLRRLSEERRTEVSARDTLNLTNEIDNLNRSLETQRDQYERTIKRINDDYQRQLSSFNRDPRVISSTLTNRSEEEEKLRVIQRNLESKIISLNEDITIEKNNHSQSRLVIAQLEIQNRDLKKRLEEAQNRITTIGNTPQGTGVEQQRRIRQSLDEARFRESQLGQQLSQNSLELDKSRRELRHFQGEINNLTLELQRSKDESDRYKKMLESRTSADRDRPRFQSGQESDRFRSPEVRQGGQGPDTPAAQLRMTSPQTVGQVREQDSETSSSRITGNLSVSQTIRPTRLMTLRQLSAERLNQNQLARIIYMLCTKIQEQVKSGRRFLYSPENIILENYNPEAIDNIKIVLKDPIDPYRPSAARKYLSPEVLQGQQASEKSCIFNIAIMWDELIHDSTFYSDQEAVLQSADYKVRNPKLNPIYKNALFEMLKRDPSRRIEFKDVMTRLSVQRYIMYEQRPN